MVEPRKCLLLPIDGTEESLGPISFLGRLYPDLHGLSLILSYFVPPLAPVYDKPGPRDLKQKKRELLDLRERDTREIFQKAKEILINAGFSKELIREHVEQKQMSVAHHACLLADLKKVDAILVNKKVSSSLEGFLRDESPSALLQHCLASPIWFVDRSVDPAHAAVCISNEETAPRIADHVSFMLAGATTTITLLHVSKSLENPLFSQGYLIGREMLSWLQTPAGFDIGPFLKKSLEIVGNAGIAEDRVSVALVPGRGNIAGEILSWCHERGIGILGLGHSQPHGTWSFLKASITKKILSEFKNMAIWVVQ